MCTPKNNKSIKSNHILGELGFPGFQIGSHVGDWNLDAKELYPIYKVNINDKKCP